MWTSEKGITSLSLKHILFHHTLSINWTRQNATYHFLNRLILKGVENCHRVSITVVFSWTRSMTAGCASWSAQRCTSFVVWRNLPGGPTHSQVWYVSPVQVKCNDKKSLKVSKNCMAYSNLFFYFFDQVLLQDKQSCEINMVNCCDKGRNYIHSIFFLKILCKFTECCSQYDKILVAW